jgi:hypothetical protein
VAYFGQPPPPHFGVILEARCPPITRFKKPAGARAVQQMIYEEGTLL